MRRLVVAAVVALALVAAFSTVVTVGVAPPAVTVLRDGCPRTVASLGSLSWNSILQWDGRLYEEVWLDADDVALRADHLAEPVGEVRCEIGDAVQDLSYRFRDGDATFLAAGTEVSAVAGFRPSFRLAADASDGLHLFEGRPDPGVARGADLYGDLAGAVTSVTVVSQQDASTVLGRSEAPEVVEALVAGLMDAEIDHDARPEGVDERYFLEFGFADAPPVQTVLFVPDHLLTHGLRVSDEFVATVDVLAGRG